jgi:hypothetical protein
MYQLPIAFRASFVLVVVAFGPGAPDARAYCEGEYDCVAMVIDSGDPVLIQMGEEMSNMVTNKDAGTFVKPTEGPIANISKVLSRENAGLSVVPSDMLQYLERMDIPVMRRARNYLRFIMTIGQKDVHVIARKELQSLEELDGKRVVVGPDNTALWVVSNNLLYLAGVNPSERLQWKPEKGILAATSTPYSSSGRHLFHWCKT